MGRWLAAWVGIALFLASGCDNASTDGGPGGGGGGGGGAGGTAGSTGSGMVPSGPEACRAQYTPYGAECSDPNVHCGPVAYCTSPIDCVACVDRCTPVGCASDAECEKAGAALCTGVVWRCDPSGQSSVCVIHDPSDPDCGNGTCEAGEDCAGCVADCGYCPGQKPLAEPCKSDAECNSGLCYAGLWCATSCTGVGWECVDHLDGPPNVCVAPDPSAPSELYCTPGCAGMSCAAYPGTSCATVPNGIKEAEQACVLASAMTGENTVAACKDGMDNDGDKFFDCDDSSCCEVVDCSLAKGTYCAKHETSFWTCKDGMDNDGDKYVDCDDANCCAFVDCSSQPSTYCGMNP